MNSTLKKYSSANRPFHALLLVVVLFMCIPLIACKEEKPNPIMTENPPNMDLDKQEITSIIDRLEKDYAPIMQMYELDMEVFVTDKNQFMTNFQSVVSKMDYMSSAIKQKLSDKLNNQQISKSTTYLRPQVDPLFEATQVADKIVIQGFDIDQNMAAVSVQLYDSMDKTTCCFTELFFDKIDDKWMLTGYDPSDEVRFRWPSTISPEKFVGLYQKDGTQDSSYSIKKNDQAYVLEFWMEKSNEIGTIKQVNILENGDYDIKIENISGEIVPSYIISGTSMKVHEYNAVSDTWEDNTYSFSQSKG